MRSTMLVGGGRLLSRLVEWYRSAATTVTSPGPAREARLSRLLHDYRERRALPTSRLRCLLSRPAETLTACHDLLRLPRLTMALTDSPDGKAIRKAVRPPRSPLRLLPHAAVLVLPETAEEYVRGASRQTLRRKVRNARRAGITWRVVDDPREKLKLIEHADEWERNTPRAQYRNPNPANDVLAEFGLWLLACSPDGHPLVLSVTPVDGEWAMLNYFRSLGAGEEQSVARYFLMTVLVEHLIASGVRYLFNAGTPIRVSNGLRHYQRMIGFRNFRLSTRRRPRRDRGTLTHEKPVVTSTPLPARSTDQFPTPEFAR